jgi:hypothetical protein
MSAVERSSLFLKTETASELLPSLAVPFVAYIDFCASAGFLN